MSAAPVIKYQMPPGTLSVATLLVAAGPIKAASAQRFIAEGGQRQSCEFSTWCAHLKKQCSSCRYEITRVIRVPFGKVRAARVRPGSCSSHLHLVPQERGDPTEGLVFTPRLPPVLSFASLVCDLGLRL